jgi:hypothetical protein
MAMVIVWQTVQAARHPQSKKFTRAPWYPRSWTAPMRHSESRRPLPELVDTLLAQQGVPALHFIDRHGENVPW